MMDVVAAMLLYCTLPTVHQAGVGKRPTKRKTSVMRVIHRDAIMHSDFVLHDSCFFVFNT